MTNSLGSRLRFGYRQFPGAPLLLFGVLCTLGILVLPMQSYFVQLALLTAETAAAFWGAWCCLKAVRCSLNWDASMRRSWQLLGASLICFALALAIGLLLLAIKAEPSAAFSVTDVFRVLQQPLMWFALLRLGWLHLTRAARTLDSFRVLIDTMIVVLAVLVLSWTTLIEPGLDLVQSSLQRAFWLYYPLADIVSLFGAVLLLFSARGRTHPTRAAGLMFLGVAFLVATNSLHLYRVLHNAASTTDLTSTTPLGLGWIWACLLIGMSATSHCEMDRAGTSIELSAELDDDGELTEYKVSGHERGERRWQQFIIIWLPYVAALMVSLLLISYESRNGRGQAVQRMLPALSLLFAVVARQMLTLRDNMQLSEQLRTANLSLEVVNVDLERNVAERTQHLSTLHGITSTLNTSLDRRTVLRVALERTISATGADGGGIWLRAMEDQSASVAESREDSCTASWELAHSFGFADNIVLENMLRDLAVAAAEEQGMPVKLLPSTRLALQYGFAPSPNNVVLVPIRWGGAVLGAFGLLRHKGSFTYDDRALVESVALETGTALQNARLYQEARHRADRDSVTGLLNHRAIQERLNAELKKARRVKSELSVVMMDLNNFKFFNDTYGHPTGDEVLRTVARYLSEVCRESDIVGRYGGDEFIALLPETSGDGAREFSSRVAARLNEHHFQADSGSRIPIEMAFGWAVFPRDADSALELLTVADAYLYESKHSGGLSQTREQQEANEQGRIEVRKLKNRAAGGSFGVLDALVTAIDNKDHYTRRHSEEVTHYSLLVARELGYSEDALRAVRISGLLHDVGKIAVPDEILRHPGHLGPEEWEIMQQHPVFGALIVKDLPHLDVVLDGVRHHHERWDGKGYPDGLCEEEIPPMGRLLAVGDCFSAMTTNRPYRKAFAPEDALREIERGMAIQFDPFIAKTFIRVMRKELAASEVPGEGAHKPDLPEISEEIREEIALLPSIAAS